MTAVNPLTMPIILTFNPFKCLQVFVILSLMSEKIYINKKNKETYEKLKLNQSQLLSESVL